MDTRERLAVLKRHFGENGNEGFCSYDYLHAKGNPKDAILYAELFVPEFVEVDGVVLLKMNVDDKKNLDRFRALKEEASCQLAELQKSFNFVEVLYCFASGRDQLSESEELALADLVAQSWRGQLALNFPYRTFEVEVQAAGAGSDVATVCFLEKK